MLNSIPTKPVTVKSYSLSLSFEGNGGFLDPLTSINMALISDGEGNWTVEISSQYPHSERYDNVPVKPGVTLPIVEIQGILYSVQFSNDGDKPIFTAIEVTITGIPMP